MRRLLPLLLAIALQIAPAASLSARWDGPGRATLTWSGPGCVYRNQTLLACYPREVGYVLELGGAGPIDAAYRPGAGDVYRLVRFDGTVELAPLRSVTYLAVVAR